MNNSLVLLNQLPPPLQIRKRKWTWIGHTLRKDPSSITRQALKWNPQGKRRRRSPRNIWRRSVEDEMSNAGHSWHTLAQMAQNRVRWRGIVSGLCYAQEVKQVKLKQQKGSQLIKTVLFCHLKRLFINILNNLFKDFSSVCNVTYYILI